MNHLDAMPPRVRLTGERAVVEVQSKTNPSVWYRVDLDEMECNCPSSTKGAAYRAKKRDGKVTWENRCPHFGLALAGYGLGQLDWWKRHLKK